MQALKASLSTLWQCHSFYMSYNVSTQMGRNIIHGSDSVESAMREIALWFRADELADYEPVTATWIYE